MIRLADRLKGTQGGRKVGGKVAGQTREELENRCRRDTRSIPTQIVIHLKLKKHFSNADIGFDES